MATCRAEVLTCLSHRHGARDFCKSLSAGADLAIVDDCELMHLLWNHILVACE